KFDTPMYVTDVFVEGDLVYLTDAGDLFILWMPFLKRAFDVSPRGNLISRYGWIKSAALPTKAGLPLRNALHQNYPNPFNPETWIPFQLAEEAYVTIEIYDSLGRLVRRLDLGRLRAGYYLGKSEAAYWDGRDEEGQLLPSGVYFYTIRAGDFSETRRMVILR
ncbi:hypothetical protein DRP77_05390, partial [Candidatus Poribacteria bacterium]